MLSVKTGACPPFFVFQQWNLCICLDPPEGAPGT
uniref:Uncharacterized protein n=1 Tax=Anguilla anguilla TaxID=7936 RepID=A0A0E9XWK2_ANGAN